MVDTSHLISQDLVAYGRAHGLQVGPGKKPGDILDDPTMSWFVPRDCWKCGARPGEPHFTHEVSWPPLQPRRGLRYHVDGGRVGDDPSAFHPCYFAVCARSGAPWLEARYADVSGCWACPETGAWTSCGHYKHCATFTPWSGYLSGARDAHRLGLSSRRRRRGDDAHSGLSASSARRVQPGRRQGLVQTEQKGGPVLHIRG